MAEAVITRGGRSADISNETKSAFGLDNNANLDDILQALAYKDPNYATIICTLIGPDGIPIQNEKIQMMDVGKANLVYTTNESGKCMFKTINQSANFRFFNNPYIDVDAPVYNVDCPIGSLTFLNVKLEKVSNERTVTSNKNIMFSKYINSVDLEVRGGGGASGFGWCYNKTCNFYAGSSSISTVETQYSVYFGSYGNNGEIKYLNNFKPSSNEIYMFNIGGISISGASSYQSGYSNSRSQQAAEIHQTGYSWSRLPIPNDYMEREIYPYSGNGATGGTAKFGSIIAANGGNGGITATSSGHGSGERTPSSYYALRYSVWNNKQYTYTDASYYLGTCGYIKFSNFSYK